MEGAVKYLLIHCVAEPFRGPEDDPAIASSLTAWFEEMTARGVHVAGDRLRPVSDATTVRIRGDEVLLADGPFAETKEQVAGYDVIDCADLDEAIEVASRHPTARLGTIEVRPVLTGWQDQLSG
jgi:hypothetical protein